MSRFALFAPAIVLAASVAGCAEPWGWEGGEDPTPSWDEPTPTPEPTPGANQGCDPIGALVCGVRVAGDTSGDDATARIDGYPVSVGNFAGPEVAWTFQATRDDTVTLAFVDPRPTLLNHDLFILESPDGTCSAADAVARGFNNLEFDVVAGRTYHVVVDGPDGQEGAFELDFDCASQPLDDPSEHYWRPAPGCDADALAGYRACLQDGGLLAATGEPVLPMDDPFWDSEEVEQVRTDCYQQEPTVHTCAELVAHDSGRQDDLGLTADPRDILPQDEHDQNDDAASLLGDQLWQDWSPSVVPFATVYDVTHDGVMDGYIACSPEDCPLSDAAWNAVYGPRCGADYGVLADAERAQQVVRDQFVQADFAVDQLKARREALKQAIAISADEVDAYNDSVIQRMTARAVGHALWAAIGGTVKGAMTTWWVDGPRNYSVQRVMTQELLGSPHAVGIDVALRGSLRDDVAFVLVDQAAPQFIQGQVDKLVTDFGETVTLQDVAIGVTEQMIEVLAQFAPSAPRAGYWRAANGALKGLPFLGLYLDLEGVIQESLLSMDANPARAAFDLQVMQMHVLLDDLKTARDERDAAIAALPGLQAAYAQLEAECSRY